MRWTDDHCHLELDPERAAEQVAAAAEAGVERLISVGCDVAQSAAYVDAARRHPGAVWATAGVHPHDAKDGIGGLEALLAEPEVVAVGECGLDFFYEHSPRDVQDRVLREQWELAVETGLPVVVHNRDSNEAMLEVVRDPVFARLTADFHSFAGGLEMGRELIARGFYIGLSGMITFPKAGNVREVIPELPADRALVETDTPFLAPIPYRGQPNRPAYVVEIAHRIESAELMPDPSHFALLAAAAR